MHGQSDLLAALQPEDRALLESCAMLCELRSGEMLCEPGKRMGHCYLPCGSATVSFLIHFDGDVSIETVMVGREGAIGGFVSNGWLPSFARSVVIHGGEFWRIALPDLQRAKLQSEGIRHLFERYADCLLAQVFQSIACNATHSIEQRAAKLLSAAVDRTGSADITMTQEQLAAMMGVGRSYASRVIQRFKRDGLVRTRRGGIEVLDGEGLRRRACSCNDTVRRHFETVFEGLYSG